MKTEYYVISLVGPNLHYRVFYKNTRYNCRKYVENTGWMGWDYTITMNPDRYSKRAGYGEVHGL